MIQYYQLRWMPCRGKAMTSIIINADDFGLSDGICKSIRELVENNAITNTTIMIAAEGARKRLSKWDVSSLYGIAGVHLQMTGGKPLSSFREVPSLIDPITKTFRNPKDLGSLNPDEVLLEWQHQIDSIADLLGGPPTHLDSHHWVHCIPECFEVYIYLASCYDIPIRGAPGSFGSLMREKGIRGTIAHVSKWSGRELNEGELVKQVELAINDYPEEDVVEIITHPGYSDDYLKSVSSLSSPRENDHNSLLRLSRIGWPMSENHALVSYRDI